jgi:hypothetical protein
MMKVWHKEIRLALDFNKILKFVTSGFFGYNFLCKE